MNLRTETLPTTVAEFEALGTRIRDQPHFRLPLLWGLGGQVHTGGRTSILASAHFPQVNGHGQNLNALAILYSALGLDEVSGVVNVEPTVEQIDLAAHMFGVFNNDGKRHGNILAIKAAHHALLNSMGKPVFTALYDQVPCQTVEDATLRLYGLSGRHFEPNTLNLDGIFGVLPTVAWQGSTPIDPEQVDDRLFDAAFGGKPFNPIGDDKFPYYIHRINAAKDGIRVIDAAKVRLGAYLGKGTTVMPGASGVNFNAGCAGDNMVEGRISSSAFIGVGTHVGGGASIIGTISGGNKDPIRVGDHGLLEINSMLGISLGDACIVGANCAVTAGSKVCVKHAGLRLWVPARRLSGVSGVTFRTDSMGGGIEVVQTDRNLERIELLADDARKNTARNLFGDQGVIRPLLPA
ncbi:MAG: tetrahydrodipicolinate N-succinyltransferase N-terminal domain-containing protein [Candidatus Magasanikbacteria bacterium]|nr:tetrahydrodipicolinate N-succinyltransferase N-terminal domain-containing protein [Candidatus Magasanikbacteria bacterium]